MKKRSSKRRLEDPKRWQNEPWRVREQTLEGVKNDFFEVENQVSEHRFRTMENN